jgi:hypothetical protein
MSDQDLMFRAQRAAAALERAWGRWRNSHGMSTPLPPVSSYVGYSIEEPWGQPRVVFGVSAEEAEEFASLLGRADRVSAALPSASAAVLPTVGGGPVGDDQAPRLQIPMQGSPGGGRADLPPGAVRRREGYRRPPQPRDVYRSQDPGEYPAARPGGYPQPVPDSGYPQPVPDSGYPQPLRDSGYPQPVPGSGYPPAPAGYPRPRAAGYPLQPAPTYPPDGGYPPEPAGGYPPEPASTHPPERAGGYLPLAAPHHQRPAATAYPESLPGSYPPELQASYTGLEGPGVSPAAELAHEVVETPHRGQEAEVGNPGLEPNAAAFFRVPGYANSVATRAAEQRADRPGAGPAEDLSSEPHDPDGGVSAPDLRAAAPGPTFAEVGRATTDQPVAGPAARSGTDDPEETLAAVADDSVPAVGSEQSPVVPDELSEPGQDDAAEPSDVVAFRPRIEQPDASSGETTQPNLRGTESVEEAGRRDAESARGPKSKRIVRGRSLSKQAKPKSPGSADNGNAGAPSSSSASDQADDGGSAEPDAVAADAATWTSGELPGQAAAGPSD